jgi:hypothetical protein
MACRFWVSQSESWIWALLPMTKAIKQCIRHLGGRLGFIINLLPPL